MRRLVVLFLIVFCLSNCDRHFTVTANPGEYNTTSGTLGSARSTYQLPERRGDTTRLRDTLRIVKDTSGRH